MINLKFDNINFKYFNLKNLFLMDYLNKYLDLEWKISKKNNNYILKKDNCKIIIDKKTKGEELLLKHLKQNVIENTIEEKITDKYILCFLNGTLNNGWTISKRNTKYIFSKNHEGKKEFFSNDYINTFLKENFKFN
jgi:hypothetical protein